MNRSVSIPAYGSGAAKLFRDSSGAHGDRGERFRLRPVSPANNAGRFPLEEAEKLVQNVEDGRISPDSSGLWLVTVPIRIDD